MKFDSAGHRGRMRAMFLAGAASLSIAAVAPAMAQDAPAQDTPAQDSATADTQPSDGNEIVVTATKRAQTLQDTPVAVSVTGEKTLEQAQIRDLKDLTSVVPSLRVTQLQSSANTNFIIRGFGNGANNAGIEPSVGVFIDGVYRSRSAAQIADFPDVSRIEVLRGPQSTLFGKNASVGVISIITKEPQFRFGGNLEASYGNYNAMVAKGMVTGPITDAVAFSLAAGVNKRDGYNHDLGTGSDTNERNRWFTRGQLLFEPSSDLKVRIIGDYGKIDENCCGVVNLRPSQATQIVRALGGNVNAPNEIFANKVYDNFDSTNDIENWGLSGQVDYTAGPVTLTSITAYRRTNAVTNQDSDFTSADLLGRNYQNLRIKTFTQELRAATDFDGPLNGLFGAYYFNEHIDQANQIQDGTQFRPYGNALIQGATGGALDVPTLETILGTLEGDPAKYQGQFFAAGQGLDERYTLKDEAFSLFGQVDLKPVEGLTLTGGVNYTTDTKHFATNVQSTDVFSGIDLDSPAYAPFRQQLLYDGALGQGLSSADAAAYAAANANNPAANPLAPLKAFQFLPPFLNLPNAVEPGRTNDDKFTYIARAAYDVTRHVNVYLSYATGFKASSVNLSRDSRPLASDAAALGAAGLTMPNQTYGSRFAGPENSSVWEFGLKADWGIATLNFAAFKQDIKGFQSNVFTGTGFQLANAGKESVKGFEFEGTVRPATPLTLGLSVTYLDPKYDDFRFSAVGDLSGTKPAGIPAISATWTASWNQPIGRNNLILRGDFHYESPVQIIEGLPGFLSGGTAAAIAAARPFRREVDDMNLSATLALHNGVELTAWARNLLDNRYLVSVFDSVAQPGSISGYTSQPRTYGGTVRVRF
ncbi:TonB-dependent receptor [Novosphingobium sp. ZN18A2]|uniref:TonB-dependent receptor n=1 Tax=Novosphingobium sp. ZN18A2 TaxID=3079861 RepID=UPI0030D1FE9C